MTQRSARSVAAIVVLVAPPAIDAGLRAGEPSIGHLCKHACSSSAKP